MNKLPTDVTPATVKDAHELARHARQLSDAHQRANRDSDPQDAKIAARGEELRRLAGQASADFEFAKQQARVVAAAKRHQQSVERDRNLQERLRDEAQARRDAMPPAPASRRSPSR